MKRLVAVLLAAFLMTVMVFPVIAEDTCDSGSNVRRDIPADITEISLGPNLPSIPLEGTYYVCQADPERAEAGLEKAYYTRDVYPDYEIWRVSKSDLGIREDDEDALLRATLLRSAVNSCSPGNYEIRTAENGTKYGYFTGYEDKSQTYPGIVYIDQWYISEDGEDIVSVVRRWKCDKINPVAGKSLKIAVPRCSTKVELTEVDHMNDVLLSYAFPDNSDLPVGLKVSSFSKNVYLTDQMDSYVELIEKDKENYEVAKQLLKDEWNLQNLGYFYSYFYKILKQERIKSGGYDVIYTEILDPTAQQSKYIVMSLELDDCFVELYCSEPVEGNTFIPMALLKGISNERDQEPAVLR